MYTEIKRLDMPRIQDPRGNLSFVESSRHIPFDIKRVFYLYDIPGGASRGGHAHKKLQHVLIALSGSFDVNVDDGVEKKRFTLDRAHTGLYIPPMMWCDIDNFSSGSVCLVLTSDFYDEQDYYREYADFISAARNGK